MRGMVNLLVLLLLTYHLRAIVDSLSEHDFILTQKVSAASACGSSRETLRGNLNERVVDRL